MRSATCWASSVRALESASCSRLSSSIHLRFTPTWAQALPVRGLWKGCFQSSRWRRSTAQRISDLPEHKVSRAPRWASSRAAWMASVASSSAPKPVWIW